MAEIHQFVPNIELKTSSRGKPYATLDNFRAILKANQVKIFYNEILKEIDICIPGKTFLPDNKLNCGISEVISLVIAHNMEAGQVERYITNVGDENKINPAKEFIESVPWDEVSRIAKFCDTIKSRNEPLKTVLMTRWMVSCIAALYEPMGISAGGMLVLTGKTNVGKTNWFKNLLPVAQQSLLKDGMFIDPHKRDSFMPCLENWLVELGEIDATFKRADLAALKAFITSNRDITRLSYAHGNSRFPRRTIFMGSVDKKEFLRDTAGNRRFWTVDCVEIDHTHGLDMQQIWAEFKVLYDNDEPWQLQKDEFLQLQESNKEFEVIDPIEEKLLRKYGWGEEIVDWKTATEILEDMGYAKPTDSECRKCGVSVRRLNGDKDRRSNGRTLLGLPRLNV